MTASDTTSTPTHQSLVESLFAQLCGTWNLDRQLQSVNASDPSGRCHGSATFKLREPSVWVNDDGKLELASAEMVYEERGEFEMQRTPTLQANGLKFPFSKKYVWRLQQQDGSQTPTLTVWFVKSGTENIDYLFHKVDITPGVVNGSLQAPTSASLEGHGGHLCIDDFYNSSYTFNFEPPKSVTSLQAHPSLTSWTMVHEVRGPKKDQVIETSFTEVKDPNEKL